MHDQSITGTVYKVGTINIDGEELTGVFIEIPEEILRNSSANIIYQKVRIEKI